MTPKAALTLMVEEPYLLATPGDAYQQYAANTGRFLSHVGRLAS